MQMRWSQTTNINTMLGRRHMFSRDTLVYGRASGIHAYSFLEHHFFADDNVECIEKEDNG